jgi:hypothetical protein
MEPSRSPVLASRENRDHRVAPWAVLVAYALYFMVLLALFRRLRAARVDRPGNVYCCCAFSVRSTSGSDYSILWTTLGAGSGGST